MLNLHLKKSRAILDGRLVTTRRRLQGLPLRPEVRLPIASKRHFLYQNAQKLIHKSIKDHTNNQKIIFESSEKKTEQTAAKPVIAPVQVTAAESKQQESQLPPKPKKSWPVRTAIFTVLMSLSFALLVTLFGPIIYFRFFGHEVVPVQTTETGTVLGGDFQTSKPEETRIAQPPQEDGLPEGNWLIIPRIGVNTQILESEVPEPSLAKGVWRAPDFGQPGDQEKPMILAAHRYGYNWWWKGEYWKYNSFYLLPELQPGDYVEVISNKRKYLYEIYSGEEGTEITDYSADLILYTCKYLTSDIRHFRYARLIDPSKYPSSIQIKAGKSASTSAKPATPSATITTPSAQPATGSATPVTLQ